MINLSRAKQALVDVDGLIRQQAADRAAIAQNAREYGIVSELRSRMGAESPDIEGVEARIRSAIGGGEGEYTKALKSRARGADNTRELLYQSAAMNSRPGLVQMLNERLAGEGKMDRAVQVGTYGAIGGGVVMGLTPAGQGLEALMRFIENGNQQEEAREYPLS